MILVDSRIGSADIAPYLERLHMAYSLETLTAGDFCFEGQTNQGLGMIGIELKRIKDLLGSMRTGRLVGEQLPKMFEQYDFSYLFVEGVIRAHPQTGLLEECVSKFGGNVYWRPVMLGNARFMWEDLNHYLTTLEHSRLKIRYPDDALQTAQQIHSLYTWYTGKNWAQHKSLKALYSSPMPTISLEDKTSLVRRVAKELDGIGADRSLSVALKFRSVRDLVQAGVQDWQTIPGIGPGISKRVVDQINGVGEVAPYGPDE